MWKRSAADSSQRRWNLSDGAQVVTTQDDRLRIVPRELWDRVKERQQAIEGMSVRLRGALKRNGRLPRYVLSGLLVCEQCGGNFRAINQRLFGCASHVDGGDAACTNSVYVRIDLAERKLLEELAAEMVSPEAVELLERQIRAKSRERAKAPKPAVKVQPAQEAKAKEIEQLRDLMKAGTLSQGVAQAAIEQAEQELRTLARAQPEREEKDAGRVIRMLPGVAKVLRERIGAGNLGLKTPAGIIQGRNVLFEMFGGKVPLRPAEIAPGERPYLIARVKPNRNVLIQAAVSAAGCLESGSGGRI